MRIDLDQIAKILDLPTWEDWSEHFDYSEAYMHAYNAAYDEAISDGEDEADAVAAGEEAGQAAEHEEEVEHYHRYYDNLMSVAEDVFGEHNLSLVPTDPPGSGPGYQMKNDLDGVRTKRKKRR